ncbi:MAG: hypothetical protein ABI333_15920 [bacterium]
MSGIDKYINEMRQSGETSLVLLSESRPRLKGKGGERTLPERVGHKEVTTLVEEIVPPEAFADLVMMEPVEFSFRHEAGELAIRVVPGPSIWRVVFEARGGLAPLPAKAEPPPQSPPGPETLEGDRGPASPGIPKAGSAKSWNELEQSVGPRGMRGKSDNAGDEPVAGQATKDALTLALEEASVQSTGGDDDDVPLSEALLRDPGEGFGVRTLGGETMEVPGEEEEGLGGIDLDLAAFLPPDREGGAKDGKVDEDPEARDYDAREQVDRGIDDAPAFAIRKMTQFGKAAGPEVSEDEYDDEDDEDDELPPALTSFVPDIPRAAVADGRRPPDDMDENAGRTREFRALGAVEPLEIDFTEEDLPEHAIDGLDSLLDAAWGEGATGVLLRDHRTPLMDHAGALSPVPLASAEQGHLVHDVVDIAASPAQAERLERAGFARFLYKTGGSRTRVRCTLVKDRRSIVALFQRIGEEHLPACSEAWLSQTVRTIVPSSGLVLICGGVGQGKTTTASAVAAARFAGFQQAFVVGEPLERPLPDDGSGLIQRQIPTDVPDVGQALDDARQLGARMVLVDVPRPEGEAVSLLDLAGQGRLVLATWTAPSCVDAVQALMDALPPGLAPAECARRARNLAAVVAVRLLPAAAGGVLPIFEALRVDTVLLTGIAEGRMDVQRAAQSLALTFRASEAALRARDLLRPEAP